MSIGTILAAMPKPFDEMTPAELQRERDFWQRYADDTANTGASVGVARDFCLMFDGLLARRGSQAEGASA